MPRRGNGPKVIFVDLPKKESKVYISLLFSYGYYLESQQEFGMGHLLEHYLAFRMEEKIGKSLPASIGNRSMQFNIEASKSNFKKKLYDVLSILKDDPIASESILKREKARIKIELDELYSRLEKHIEHQALRALFSGPNYVTRNRILQNAIVPKITLKELRILRNTLMGKHFLGIVVGGYKLPKSARKEIEDKVEDLFPRTKSLTEAPKPHCKITKAKSRTINHYGIKPGYTHVSILWPGISLADSIVDRFALRYLCGQLTDRLNKPLGDIGIYGYDYNYALYNKFGYVRFYGYIPEGMSKRFENIIYQEINLLIQGKKTIESDIKKYISKRAKNLRDMWGNNFDRMDWVVDDMIDYGKIVPLSKIILERKKMNALIVSRVAIRVFSKKNQRTLIVRSAQSRSMETNMVP